MSNSAAPQPEKVSDQLERWLESDGHKTLGNLIELFEEKSFAIVFVLLMGVPALPLPTGGGTHVFEIITALLALELIAGRDQIWLPRRWCGMQLAGPNRERFLTCISVTQYRRLSRMRARTANAWQASVLPQPE